MRSPLRLGRALPRRRGSPLRLGRTSIEVRAGSAGHFTGAVDRRWGSPLRPRRAVARGNRARGNAGDAETRDGLSRVVGLADLPYELVDGLLHDLEHRLGVQADPEAQDEEREQGRDLAEVQVG